MLSIPTWPVAVPSRRPLVPDSGMGASSGGGVDCREMTRDGLGPSASKETPVPGPALLLAGREIAFRPAAGWVSSAAGRADAALDELPTSDASGDELLELSDECVEPFGRL